MASGFGTFRPNTYVTSGNQRVYMTAIVSQSIDSSARKVTITVRTLLTVNRYTGGAWNPGTSSIFTSSYGSNYISATLDGSTTTAGSGGKLGLSGNNQSLAQGSYHHVDETNPTYVKANGTARAEKSITYSYNSSGSAITKSWEAKMSYSGTTFSAKGSVTTDSISPQGNPPSNYSVENIIPEWDRITFTSIVGNNGGVDLNSHCPSIQKEPLVSGRQKYENTYSTSNTIITSTVSNSSSKINNPTWEIKGCGLYYTGAYASNGISPNLYGQGPSTYTPPAPSILNVSSASEGYNISFTGDTSKNNSDYDAASLTRTVRYKVDNGNWIYLENNTQRAIDYLTTGSILESYVFQIVVQGWMTYHNLDSVISEYIIEPPGRDYKSMGPGIGKFDNSAVNFDKMYIAQSSVTKKLDKLYISVNGSARRIF